MANKVLIQALDSSPDSITFCDTGGDFNPTTANDLRPGVVDTECQLSLASVADGAARQSTKVDLGEHRADEYAVRVAFEMAATPTAGDLIEIYWAPSAVSTASDGNPGGVSGSDAAFTGYGTLSEATPQLHFIGVAVAAAVASSTTPSVQIAEVGTFSPTERYGTLVVKNESGAAFWGDDVESHVVFDPVIPELQ